MDKRMEKIIQFTQGQGGGVPGASTCDHLFLVRAAMQIAVEKKTDTLLNFLRREKSI